MGRCHELELRPPGKLKRDPRFGSLEGQDGSVRKVERLREVEEGRFCISYSESAYDILTNTGSALRSSTRPCRGT